jgi:hypothetical protein
MVSVLVRAARLLVLPALGLPYLAHTPTYAHATPLSRVVFRGLGSEVRVARPSMAMGLRATLIGLSVNDVRGRLIRPPGV